MFDLDRIVRPALLLDERTCQTNIERMQAKAAKHGLIFRPHFKTHQSRAIAAWFKERGIEQITVSSLSMADYFARDGWQDITVAFPLNIREIALINHLAGSVQLNLLVEDQQHIQSLAHNTTTEIGLFLKIDTGYHRTGVPVERVDVIDQLVKEISRHPRLHFKGFLTHAGNTYHAQSKAEILNIHQHNLQKLTALKQRYLNVFPDLIVSIGDTPSCSLAEDFSGIDEIRPGNFVFFDVMQWRLGSCSLKDIAVALACPVVAKHAERMEVVLYGGAIHLSKEQIAWPGTQACYGILVELDEEGWQIPKTLHSLIALSQEHGIARVDQPTFEKIQIGQLVGVLPVHSCLAANLMRQYHGCSGQVYDHFENASFVKSTSQ